MNTLPAFLQLWFLSLQEINLNRLLRLSLGVIGGGYAFWQIAVLSVVYGSEFAVGIGLILLAGTAAVVSLPGLVTIEHKPSKK